MVLNTHKNIKREQKDIETDHFLENQRENEQKKGRTTEM